VVGRFDRREIVVPIEQRRRGSTRVRVGDVLRQDRRHELSDSLAGLGGRVGPVLGDAVHRLVQRH